MRTIFALFMLTLAVLLHQNCTRPSFGGEGEVASLEASGGNAGGYDGKPYVEPALPGDCPENENIRTKLLVPAAGDPTMLVKNCVAIAPLKVPRSLLRIHPQTVVIDYDGRALIDLAERRLSMVCGFSSTTTNSFSEERVLVTQTGSNFEVLVHRATKFSNSTSSFEVSAPIPVVLRALSGSTDQSEFVSATNDTDGQAILSPFATSDYQTQTRVTTQVSYQAGLIDLISGARTVASSTSNGNIVCAVPR